MPVQTALLGLKFAQIHEVFLPVLRVILELGCGQNRARFCSIICKKEGGFAVKIVVLSHISFQPRDYPISPFVLKQSTTIKH